MPQNPAKLRVLIADPSSHMAALVAQMLHSLKIRSVEAVIDLDQVRAELAGRAYDIVLIDEHLGGTGFELIAALRKTPDHLNRLTPIIMMAAAPDAKMITAARDAGVTEFLKKPFSAQHVQMRIDTVRAAPRPCVEAGPYAGPDRRRKIVTGKVGRRAADKSTTTA